MANIIPVRTYVLHISKKIKKYEDFKKDQIVSAIVNYSNLLSEPLTVDFLYEIIEGIDDFVAVKFCSIYSNLDEISHVYSDLIMNDAAVKKYGITVL